jgi:hypothetical protein
VEPSAIHRLIERHAATQPESPALVDGARVLTYRELNCRANACARYLLERGFRRGAHGDLRFDHGADLAIVMLALLKAGGSYAWSIRDDSGFHRAMVILRRDPFGDHGCLFVDLAPVLGIDAQSGPNLPVLTRASDVACVLEGRNGPEVLIPHASIVALQRSKADAQIEWAAEPGALDLWIVLMAGGTATTGPRAPTVAPFRRSTRFDLRRAHANR